MIGNGVWGISLLSRYATEKYDVKLMTLEKELKYGIRDDARADSYY
jgi:glycerol-3-phosphate dehydrogenase